MHFPVHIRLFSFSIHPHFLFESLAYSIGFLVFRLFKGRLGDVVPQDVRWSVIAAAAFGAAAGSKVLYWLEDTQRIITHWNNFAIVWGGKTIVGGLIGGLISRRGDQEKAWLPRAYSCVWERPSVGLDVFLQDLKMTPTEAQRRYPGVKALSISSRTSPSSY